MNPYSAAEFPREGDETNSQAAYRHQREKLDAFNHEFWVSSPVPPCPTRAEPSILPLVDVASQATPSPRP